MFPLSWVLQNQPHPATPLGCFLEECHVTCSCIAMLAGSWEVSGRKGKENSTLGCSPTPRGLCHSKEHQGALPWTTA